MGGIESTDVCLILESTYPYIRGGVSSWVHSLIQGLPDLTFSLLSVSAARQSPADWKYELPPNVKVFADVFVHELASGFGGRPSRASWEAFRRLHCTTGRERVAAGRDLLLSSAAGARGGLTADHALFSHAGWDLLLQRYQASDGGGSFIDFFWTWRAVHAPLFQTMLAEIPPARIYHAVSTGYAGLLGAIAKIRTGRPFLLTEHGIYVRERLIDIARADWIFEEPVRVKAARPDPSPLKALWADHFRLLAQLAYGEADLTIALFEGNQQLQLEAGADSSRSWVIPNGVPIERFAPLVGERHEQGRALRVGFVGRVVPIKDVKTLLRAFDLVSRRMPDAELWIVGPTDEDAAYFADCQELVRALGLQRVTFTGSQDVRRIYPEIDVMVLTSLSEGQPLTILEAACAGVPTVATDVGDCRSLVEGRSPDDIALGPSGIVTRIGDPEATAEAILQILSSESVRADFRRAGVERARRHYPDRLVLERYRGLYRALASGARPPVLDGVAPAIRAAGAAAMDA
jgi:glycosyltransferase involved in cell wall biosynthesis